MSKLKRGDEIGRPKPWRVMLHNTEAARGWTELKRQAPDSRDRAWVDITAEPRSVANSGRQHRLKAALGAVKVGAAEIEQWQYEITGGGRLWYAIEDDQRTLWITKAETGHPGITDRNKGGGRRMR